MTPDVPPTDPSEPPRGSRRAGVIALALVGLALTAGITYAASTVVSQPIGLTSEPATVGDSLAPGAPITTSTTTSTAPATTTVTTTVTTPPTTTTATTPPPTATATTPATTTTSGGDDHHGDDDHDDD